ncbi:protein CASP [Lepeophtheirus salmonis]|uniref:protein CASP n=1 Tax=Lepeophtheirus salmonis TaxID=72036 RepID=UPI001AE5737F|nr:protein CASP-like [Lepeophtheirus salmonis]
MSGNRIKSLLKSWEDFGLHSFQEDLDSFAAEITDRVDKSEESKAQLINEYSKWINDSNEVKSPTLTHLITSFQSQVDELTKRSTESEKGFLKLYSKIITDLKDPVPVLMEIRDSVLGRLSKYEDLEIEVSQLRETLKDYNSEISKSRSNDKKLADLKAKVEAYDRNIDATLQERIGEVTKQIAEDSYEKVKEIKYENDMLEMRLSDIESRNRDLQTKHDMVQTELFDLKRRREEKSDAIGSEIDILYDDLENTQSRFVIAEKENEAFKEEISELKRRIAQERLSSSSKEDESAISIREFEAKTREIQRLIKENDQFKKQNSALEEYYDDKFKELDNVIMDLKEQVKYSDNQLSKLSDYDSIKKELHIFKSLEFDDNQEDKPLETLILGKSKELQTKNSLLRLDNEQLRSEFDTLQSKHQLLSSANDKQRDLIAELEKHVESLQNISDSRGEAEGRSSTDILNDALNDEEGGNVSKDDNQNSSSLLPIIKAQRERFRLRHEELEELQSKQLQQMSLLQKEVSDLQRDNVKLYEKIRFLQSPGSTHVRISGDSSEVESRYSTTYEQNLNPFTTFNRREKNRQYGNLNVVEKIILSMVRFMMSNKTARLFIFIYSMLLHGLVFLVLMKMAYHDSELRDMAAEWHDKYSKHMIEVHQSANVG